MEKAEKQLNILLARRFVRSEVLSILKDFAGSKKDPQEIINKINNDILKGFVAIAKEEISHLMAELNQKLK